jgi:hypothetical protein
MSILKKLHLEPGSSTTRAINITREFLDNQRNPLGAANSILVEHGIKPLLNCKKAYIYALSVVEDLVNSREIVIKDIIDKANSRIDRITDIMGPYAFVDDSPVDELPVTKKGGKRAVARELYYKYKDTKDEKSIIELVQKELGVTKPNAYSYIYLVKKEMKLQ